MSTLRLPAVLKRLMVLLPCALLAACVNTGDRNMPIPTRTALAGASPGDTLVIVLPGRWDNVEVMAGAGVVEVVQGAWPEADVLLTGATMAYYTDGRLAERLHEQVVAPARKRGYRTVWMMGASMGGLGTLLYEQAYPGQLDGLVLLAPYLGRSRLLREIADAGGIQHWSPGPFRPSATARISTASCGATSRPGCPIRPRASAPGWRTAPRTVCATRSRCSRH